MRQHPIRVSINIELTVAPDVERASWVEALNRCVDELRGTCDESPELRVRMSLPPDRAKSCTCSGRIPQSRCAIHGRIARAVLRSKLELVDDEEVVVANEVGR